MAENKGYAGGGEGDDEEMKMTKEKRKEEEEGDLDMPGKVCQSEKKEADPDLKDSDADFEDLEQEGGGGNALGDGLERLWTGFGGILSRHIRWVDHHYEKQCHHPPHLHLHVFLKHIMVLEGYSHAIAGGKLLVSLCKPTASSSSYHPHPYRCSHCQKQCYHHCHLHLHCRHQKHHSHQ